MLEKLAAVVRSLRVCFDIVSDAFPHQLNVQGLHKSMELALKDNERRLMELYRRCKSWIDSNSNGNSSSNSSSDANVQIVLDDAVAGTRSE
jgi:hypothetical protein